MNKRIILGFKVLTVAIVLAALFIAGLLYVKVFRPVVELPAEQAGILYIPTGSDLEEVARILKEEEFVSDTSAFLWLARKKNYHNHVYPGRYNITDGMNLNALINLLRSGRQTPVHLIFNNICTLPELAGIVGKQIEPDSAALLEAFLDKNLLDEIGFTAESVYALFIPNTYEIYWNTAPEEFMKRMSREYKIFWAGSRLEKASLLNMEPVEVSTLASIVDEEAIWDDEMKRVAGLYINRLEKGIRLQADPTIKFAVGDLGMNRVLNHHLDIDSPYNTYKYSGLPPGPISVPSIAAIDAVLNYERHDYLYMCARADFSGYHHFSRTLAQHNRYAREYRRALNQRRIFN